MQKRQACKGLFIPALILLALALPAAAQIAMCSTATIPLCTPGNAAALVQIKPQAVPTSTTIVTIFDAYLSTITVSNPTSGAITFTLADRQASPIAALPAVSIPANTAYVIVWPAGYWCPNGFTITSSGAGLTVYGAFKQ